MNAPAHSFPVVGITDFEHADRAFKSARDQLLAAFVKLEVAVARWLAHLEIKTSPMLLGQRIDQLANHSDLAAKAKPKQVKRIRALGSDCSALLNIRNACVHSAYALHDVDGEWHIFFRAVEHVVRDEPIYLVKSLRDVASAAKDANRKATWLSLWLTQASSPPQP
jgi:hypothetical protein